MAKSLFTRGLELFAAGDLAGAARLWWQAREAGGGEPALEQHLQYVRQVAPGVLEAVQAERQTLSPAPASGPRRAPLADVPIPVPPQQAAALPPASDPWGGAALVGPPIVVSGAAGGLGLVAGPVSNDIATSAPGELLEAEGRLKALLELDNFTAALDVAEQILQGDPVHPAAAAARERCRATLRRMYEAKLGDLSLVPRVLVPPDQVIWLDLDHRSGFILAQVDGMSTYEDLVDLAGMDRLEALRLLAQLVQNGVIGSSSSSE